MVLRGRQLLPCKKRLHGEKIHMRAWGGGGTGGKKKKAKKTSGSIERALLKITIRQTRVGLRGQKRSETRWRLVYIRWVFLIQ